MFGSKEGGTTEQPELCRGKIIGEPNFDTHRTRPITTASWIDLKDSPSERIDFF